MSTTLPLPWYYSNRRFGLYLQGPSGNRAGELLKFSRNQLREMRGLLTGHCLLKRYLFKSGLVDKPGHNRCQQASEMASHVPCNCDALAVLTFRHQGHHFLKPGDHAHISLSKILHFVKSVKLLNA